MNKLIYDFENHFKYLDEKLSLETGLKTRYAEFIGCKTSYLSKILRGDASLTLEQAFITNEYFRHNKLESKYFITLVECDRAGTKKLKDYFASELEHIKQQKFNLKNRIDKGDELPVQMQQKYYSSWFFSAIHMILALPDQASVKQISARLNLPEPLVVEIIDFLLQSGMVSQSRGKYMHANDRTYLSRASDFIQQNHMNWRTQALQSVEKNLSTDLHYSNVMAISKKDYENIKEILIQAIVNSRKLIGDSKEEDVFAMTIDCFKV